jgi:CRISPR/Cas system endoribonuclease Cas6 (RAMP superfamily)
MRVFLCLFILRKHHGDAEDQKHGCSKKSNVLQPIKKQITKKYDRYNGEKNADHETQVIQFVQHKKKLKEDNIQNDGCCK